MMWDRADCSSSRRLHRAFVLVMYKLTKLLKLSGQVLKGNTRVFFPLFSINTHERSKPINVFAAFRSWLLCVLLQVCPTSQESWAPIVLIIHRHMQGAALGDMLLYCGNHNCAILWVSICLLSGLDSYWATLSGQCRAKAQWEQFWSTKIAAHIQVHMSFL